MRAGRLRHRVTIQRRVESRNSFGEQIATWEDVAYNVPASVEPLQGREYFAAAQVQSTVEVRIRLRYMPGIRTTMRVLHAVEVVGSPQAVRYYNIEAVLNIDERNRELNLMCSARDDDGFRSEREPSIDAGETPDVLALDGLSGLLEIESGGGLTLE